MRRLLSSCRSLPMKLHVKCRGGLYPLSDGVQRADVPEDKVPWSVAWPEYAPVAYTSPVVGGKPWADPELGAAGFQPRWNALDGGVDRRSQQAEYAQDAAGAPLNPVGRTGVSGRGLLGRWGPNHAADPLVTRWRRAEDGTLWRHPSSGRPQLQLVTVQRRDCGLWALPGGMVDPGERVTAAVQREFQEEALNALEASPERRRQLTELVRELFAGGRRVYAGYVDDPRNTDNAWMETEAYNFHDETGTAVGAFPLQAGDDARAVRWTDVSGETELYASHLAMVQAVAEMHSAHW